MELVSNCINSFTAGKAFDRRTTHSMKGLRTSIGSAAPKSRSFSSSQTRCCIHVVPAMRERE